MGESLSVPACSLTKVIYVLRVETVFAGGEEERYFALVNDAQGGGPAGDQNFQGRGRSPKA